MIDKKVLENYIELLEDIIIKMKKDPDNIESINLQHSKPMELNCSGIAIYTGSEGFNLEVEFLFSTGG